MKAQNISYGLNENYAKLIREKTEWFDISLALARDKLVTHGTTHAIGIKRDRKTRAIAIHKAKISGNFSNQVKSIIDIKKRYENQYPELKKVMDNLWEIMDYFMNHDISLNKKDKRTFIDIVHRTGGNLPTLSYIAKKMIAFLESFAKAFES